MENRRDKVDLKFVFKKVDLGSYFTNPHTSQ